MPPQSKYSEILQELIRRINAGEFKEGKLPSMQNLAKDYGVNLLTVKRAVKELEKQNIVKCLLGNRGTIINYERANSAGMVQTNRFVIDEALSDMSCVKLNFIYETKLETALRKITELFSKRYSWIKVNCIYDPKPQVTINSDDNSYDIVETGINNFHALSRSGRFLDLTETIAQSGTCNDSRYISNSLDFCRMDGRLYGIPFMWHTALVLKEGKQPLDSWSALESYLDANNSKTANVLCGTGLFTLMLSFLGGFEKLKSKGMSDKLSSFIRFVKVLIRNTEHLKDYKGKDFKTDGIKALIGYYCSCCDFMDNLRWHIAPLPMDNGAKAMLHTTALGIHSRTRHPQECWLWLNFLQRPEIQNILNEEPFFFSAEYSSFQKKKNPPELRKIMDYCLENGEIMRVSNRGCYIFYNTALPIINRYLEGELPEGSLIAELQDIIENTIQTETIAQ